MEFDYKKPFETKNGLKCRLLCDDLFLEHPLAIAIFDNAGYEVVEKFTKKGKKYKDDDYCPFVNIGEENTFDPTKPVQTRDEGKARIICIDRKGDQPIIALYELRDGSEECGKFSINGKFYGINDRESSYDLINIPELNPIDIHIGGVYLTKNDETYICAINESVSYIKGIMVRGSPNMINNMINNKNNLFNVYKKDIVKHMCDVDILSELR